MIDIDSYLNDSDSVIEELFNWGSSPRNWYKPLDVFE